MDNNSVKQKGQEIAMLLNGYSIQEAVEVLNEARVIIFENSKVNASADLTSDSL